MHATIAGIWTKLWMFVLRLSNSGRAFHVSFATQAQEAFLQGHVLAFAHFGAAGTDQVRQPQARRRPRPTWPRPRGIRAVHRTAQPLRVRLVLLPTRHRRRSRGGVEGEIGRFRRRHLVPVPKVASLAELNTLIAAGDLLDDTRVIIGRPTTVAAAFAAELPALMPLPAEPSDPARLLEARVDNRARVSVRQCYYSVPARYAGTTPAGEVVGDHGRGSRRRQDHRPA
ncbi:hypothetical protein ORV05_27650 [Amycolatopsis cynarae]|uniref:Transposase for insertion sequence element IS21-like C-terminal domain-containing protein n=1 Tax=Amycolatopsis cynarae TaxID=2995223 RepID=A0ABY7AXG7_9PSEU|nr:hypothetical protein [Amycolatopsis sp. HUAS 11-8]WAL64706.1 hypothetical protein ORV05_27650 [Amycolatopsis sp. HUAS 11-8]